jgi:hypothetical protein
MRELRGGYAGPARALSESPCYYSITLRLTRGRREYVKYTEASKGYRRIHGFALKAYTILVRILRFQMIVRLAGQNGYLYLWPTGIRRKMTWRLRVEEEPLIPVLLTEILRPEGFSLRIMKTLTNPGCEPWFALSHVAGH